MSIPPAKQSESEIEISQSCQLPVPEKWKGFPVYGKDWDRIKKMVDRIISPTSFWQIVWPASFGISISALLSALTILEKGHPNKTSCYWLFLLFMIIGILTLIIDKTRKAASISTKEQLKEEMEKMEEPYKTDRGYGG
ncbi:hypothetical protein HZB94_05080 [Candidatus Falkowbacteria bacterium]|nr:hypothetical protein [Candidatus Falkowbacteria bacterium]